MIVRDYHLQFGTLNSRPYTDMIVIHHTGENDIDATAEQIHEWHIANGWAGIGYHFVIRKDGTIEIGRPEWAVGSHAYGEKSHTIGIHLSGDFQQAQPTDAQINSCAELVRDLCNDYQILISRENIVGHCDLMSTDCPGKNLYARLDDIIRLAANDPPPAKITSIFDLARRYESNGDPAAVGHGYGLYQFSKSTVKQFVDWLKNYPDDKLANYGWHLASANNFDGEWQMLGTVDPGHFALLQDQFALNFFFDEAVNLFAQNFFHVEKHSLPLQAVVFARAIHHGVFGCLELFKRACPYPNLSYADDQKFDTQLITAVYNYLISNPQFITPNVKLHDALISRFHAEKIDALS